MGVEIRIIFILKMHNMAKCKHTLRLGKQNKKQMYLYIKYMNMNWTLNRPTGYTPLERNDCPLLLSKHTFCLDASHFYYAVHFHGRGHTFHSNEYFQGVGLLYYNLLDVSL